MLLMGMTWLFVSFVPITSKTLAADTIPVFCSRMFQDIMKTLTALEAGTEATGIRPFQERNIWRTELRN